jgi:SAM-dependent methyltransferase
MAATYDATFTESGVGRALREIVWSRMEQLFLRSKRVLELGCGTGEDAMQLTRSGVRVVATDPSSQMLELARRKSLVAGCQDQIEFRNVGMQDIGSFAEGELFDGVLSNFGAVNCVEDLPALIGDVAARLVPGAPLLWVLMGRHAPWEWLWYLTRGQWRKAWRRLSPSGVEWRGMIISYPTPREMKTLLRPYFSVSRVAPLGFALPPSYAAAWLNRAPLVSKLLTYLERRAQRVSFLASLSDHFIVEAVRLPP